MNEFVQLLVKYLSHTFRHGQLACFFLEPFHELVLSIALHTQLFFDAFELLHQVIFSLSFLYFGVYVAGDLKLQLGIDELLFEKHEGALEAIFDRCRGKNSLQVGYVRGGYYSCEIGQLVGLVKDLRRSV